MTRPVMLERLDYVYTPSRDVAADIGYFTDVLGANVVFAIEGMGTRVAMLELGDGPPHIVLADHLDSERPILVYRVGDLADAMGRLRARGWSAGSTLELPQGPACSFTTPAGHRVAIYELTRPQVIESFAGRRDF